MSVFNSLTLYMLFVQRSIALVITPYFGSLAPAMIVPYFALNGSFPLQYRLYWNRLRLAQRPRAIEVPGPLLRGCCVCSKFGELQLFLEDQSALVLILYTINLILILILNYLLVQSKDSISISWIRTCLYKIVSIVCSQQCMQLFDKIIF